MEYKDVPLTFDTVLKHALVACCGFGPFLIETAFLGTTAKVLRVILFYVFLGAFSNLSLFCALAGLQTHQGLA